MSSKTLQAEDPNQLMKEREAANSLCISQRTLQKWRVTGFGPEYIHISSRAVRYRSIQNAVLPVSLRQTRHQLC